MPMPSYAALVLMVVWTLGQPAAVSAQNASWVTPTAGSFHDPARWSGAAVPTALGTATFGGTAGGLAFGVTFAEAVTTSSLRVMNQRPRFLLGGEEYDVSGNITASGSNFPVSYPILTVGGGTLDADGSLELGQFFPNRGEVSVVSGGVLECATLRMGLSGGVGSLRVSDGGVVRVMNGSNNLFGEGGGSASLELDSGSLLTFPPNASISFGGFNGLSAVSVAGGSRVQFGVVPPAQPQASVFIGGAGGTFVMSNPGSSFGPVSLFTVGFGAATVSDGAVLSAGRIAVGSSTQTSASLTVTGPEARVVFAQEITVGATQGGPVNVVPSLLGVYNGARVVGARATPGLSVNPNGQLRGDGVLECPVTTGGTITVSSSPTALVPGTLTILGQLNLSPMGSIVIPVAGTAPGSQHGQIVVTGFASLTGLIRLEPVGGFRFAPGQTFEVLRSLSSTTQSPSVSAGPGAGRTRLRVLTPPPQQGSLVIAVTCPADWSGDGLVSVEDIFRFLGSYFAGSGDFDGGGTTELQDLFDFLGAYFAGGAGAGC